jgi:hypothetical protein
VCTSHSGDLLTGYLEKRIGENSGRQSLPEAWKWQKRYFVLTEPKGMLYYFKSPDDPPNYKVPPSAGGSFCPEPDVHLASLLLGYPGHPYLHSYDG